MRDKQTDGPERIRKETQADTRTRRRRRAETDSEQEEGERDKMVQVPWKGRKGLMCFCADNATEGSIWKVQKSNCEMDIHPSHIHSSFFRGVGRGIRVVSDLGKGQSGS